MRLTGIQLVLTDAPPETAEKLDRWYDLEAIPEQTALPGVLGVKRYVAGVVY